MQGRFELNLSEVNSLLGTSLKEGGTAHASAEDLEPYLTRIQRHLSENVSFSIDSKVQKISFTKSDILHVGARTGSFWLLDFSFDEVADIPETMEVRSNIFFDQDPVHQTWLMIEYNWKAGIHKNEAIPSLIFTPSSQEQRLSLTGSSMMKGFIAMIYQGMKHIWIGLDHILFLLALLLPAVISRFRKDNEHQFSRHLPTGSKLSKISPKFLEWGPWDKFRPAFINVLKVVTFFTLAHTITLSLAALNIVVLPGRLVESIIAFSIALAAFHNIRPIFQNEWLIVFGFGLFHGFGFASVLGDIGLSGEYLVLSLLGFNIGVEIGQIVIICLIFPPLFMIRRSRLFPHIFVFGSIFLILLSLYWFLGRAIGFDVFGEDLIVDIYLWIKGLISPTSTIS
ncbi:MAG: HupE/UreJ family protein [Bacteroidota bacterium]